MNAWLREVSLLIGNSGNVAVVARDEVQVVAEVEDIAQMNGVRT